MSARVLIAAFALLAGCASMNKSECLTADWRTIGFEDGSAGRSPAYISEHRQACAPHHVTPDLDAYNGGHEEGIRLFCVRANGFRVGHSGGTYSGVCPEALEAGFLSGYRAGRELFEGEQAVQQVRAAIAGYQRQIREGTEALAAKQEALVRDGATESERRQLLKEVNELREQLEEAKIALATAEGELPPLEQTLEALRQSADY